VQNNSYQFTTDLLLSLFLSVQAKNRNFAIMADVDNSSLQADSKPKSGRWFGLKVLELYYIHQINRVNSGNDLVS